MMKLILVSALLMALSACASQPLSAAFDQRIALANHAYQIGDLNTAEATWRQVLKIDAEVTEGWCALGHIAFRQQRYEEALRHYEQCLKLMPEQPKIWHNLAVIRIRQATETLIIGAPYQAQRAHPNLLNALLRLQRIAELETVQVDAETSP